ncbi:hypothetical protein [Sulfurimonas sp.]|uniref:hypothetical protein n=1 Tax=Sulfurimonas sp. TaxID=2022749 RepID=UPI0025ED4441|nr:hypothetical protein [Sulfurimonas sp.]MBW6488348.1 hypothetical protein [Sulfurimonas sp.]
MPLFVILSEAKDLSWTSAETLHSLRSLRVTGEVRSLRVTGEVRSLRVTGEVRSLRVTSFIE